MAQAVCEVRRNSSKAGTGKGAAVRVKCILVEVVPDVHVTGAGSSIFPAEYWSGNSAARPKTLAFISYLRAFQVAALGLRS